MKKMLAVACFALVGLLAATQAANAQATRTWVSGVGDDANPCSRTAPCKTFAGAISKTAVGGEINCIDPGGFGALTITKSIAIICDDVEAGVLVSGTNGISISAGPTDTIFLSGIDFEGLGSSLDGIHITTAGTVTVRHSKVRGFQNGINVVPTSPTLVNLIDDVIADNSAEGIIAKPGGGGSVRLMADQTRSTHNGGDGFMANGNGGGPVKMSIRNCESANNTGDGYVALSSSSVAQIMIDASSSFNNNIGIHAAGTVGIVRFTRSSVTGNGTGVQQDGLNTALSYGTNSVDGNGSDGAFATTPQK